MIREALRREHILVGLDGGPEDDVRSLLSISSCKDQQDLIPKLLQSPRVDDGVTIYHCAVDGFSQSELYIASIAPRRNAGALVALLLCPVDQPAGNLQLLERLLALLPPIGHRVAALRDPDSIRELIGREETESIGPTYINLTQQELAVELRTDLERGLSEEEAHHRLGIYGRNQLRKTRSTPWYAKLLKNFFSLFALLLWGATILCFVPGVDMPQLGIAIAIVIAINGFFSFLQEEKSDRAVEALQKLLSHNCRVMRGGAVVEIDAELIVPGDIVILEEGDSVPADGRLIEAFEVEVDNSSLTGESTSAKRYKSDQSVLLDGRFLWIEMPNIVFAGSSLVKGQGKAVVFGTGMATEIGRIAGMTQSIKSEDSPLQKELRATVRTIAFLAGAIALLFLGLGWYFAGLSFLQAFIFCIGLFVANVPEGLLPTVTLSLAIGVTRMARRNAIVKNLASVETLGSTSVICTDKTGTLTQNLMMVQEIFVNGEVITVDGNGYEPTGVFKLANNVMATDTISRNPALFRLLQCSFVCNNARIEKVKDQYRMTGDPTEGALMALAMKGKIRGTHQTLRVNPFESVRKRMSVLVRSEAGPGVLVFAKGAPLELLGCCDRIMDGNGVRSLTEAEHAAIIRKNDEFARRGLRVLALAYKEESNPESNPDNYDAAQAEARLIFLGLTAMNDPVRPGVSEAIAKCHGAGIRIIMITGDYALTAGSIAAKIGMNVQADDAIVTGADLNTINDETLFVMLKAGDQIFARVSPEHKLRIVSALKKMGEIVAVTGDGVNDAPALKRADIGIAMGLRGNDVAKEAAHMVLVDDNFSSIVAAIEEGRAIFDNIRKFMGYILNSNPQEMYPYILWMMLPGAPLAMTVMGVLAVDVGTDLIPAMGLGAEPPAKDVMRKPPRSRKEKLLSVRFILLNYFVQGSILALGCFLCYFYMGWVLGSFKDGFSIFAMPASPKGLDMSLASGEYLMTLTAFFFPTVTTQIANVLCKRSYKESLFSREFLAEGVRQAILGKIRALPERFSGGGRIAGRLAEFLAAQLDKHYVVLNIFSNPLINAGIVFELVLCVVFFYTPMSDIYFFAPVPWHVYLVALIGPALLLIFEEGKKYFRRRGYALDILN